MIVFDLDSSWLEACLRLDQRALNGLWTAEQWRRELQEPRRLRLGLRDGKQLMGVACGWLVADELHVTAVAVDPSARRGGHGRRLLAELLQRALQEGAARATLEVACDNKAAVALYAGGGFRTAGTRSGYYRNGRDALIQWCRLTSIES